MYIRTHNLHIIIYVYNLYFGDLFDVKGLSVLLIMTIQNTIDILKSVILFEGCLNFSIFILKSLQKYSSQSNFKVYVFINSVWINLLQFSYHISKSSWWFFVMLNGQFALSCFSMRFNVFGGPLMSFFFINSYFVKFLSLFLHIYFWGESYLEWYPSMNVFVI